ncbi:MAG: DNA internalization-related competence protein ComEC/Rec2 [Nitrospirae bacterium]|nr:DNA internalization-related competence protein ComEC/Rec2 [Nitrospirota bacterium]
MLFFSLFLAGTASFFISRYFPYSSIFFSIILFTYLTIRFLKKRTIFFLLLALDFSAGFFYAEEFSSPSVLAIELEGKEITIKCSPVSEAIPADTGAEILYKQTVKVHEAVDRQETQVGINQLRLLTHNPLDAEGVYLATGTFPRGRIRQNPGSIETMPVLKITAVSKIGNTRFSFFQKARHRLNDFMVNNFSPDSAGFLMSIVTGERGYIQNETKKIFNITGLAHVLSISGAHFGLLLFAIFRIFKLIITFLPYGVLARLTLHLTVSQISAMICLPVIAFYFMLAAESFPATRSFIMITLFLAGLLIQRRGFWLNTLLLAASMIILMQPDALLDISFQLSFIAVLCIGAVVEKRTDENPDKSDKEGFIKKSLAILRSSLMISLAATIGTAPLVAYYFHYFSLISPISNLFITPVIGFIILPLAFISSIIYLQSGYFPFLSFIDASTIKMIDAIRIFGSPDLAGTAVPAFPPALLLFFYSSLLILCAITASENRVHIAKKTIILTAVAAVAPFLFYFAAGIFKDQAIKITWLDVGQGDSAVVELPDKKILVVDSGRSGYEAAEFLKYRGRTTIDALIISHGQEDHSGGIKYLKNNFKVSEIWDNGRNIYGKEILDGVLHRKLKRGDTVEGKNYSILILHPHDSFVSSGTGVNDDSLFFKIQGKSSSFLFTGDIEGSGIDDILYLGKNLKNDVLKVPHHGSRTSVSHDMINAISPEIAIISAGRGNSYGHPHAETLSVLSGSQVLRTDKDGAIGIAARTTNLKKIKTFGEFKLKPTRSLSEEKRNLIKLFEVW